MSTHSQLPRGAPEAQGIASAALLAFVDAADQTIEHLHSLMILRHGQVVAEGWWAPYAPDLPHMLFSLSKSFASTAVGLAVAEGRLTVDDKVIDFFPDDLPAVVSENLAAMRVRHLLSMSTGHAQDATDRMIDQGGENWVRGFLALPVEHAPGAPFVYNSAATYMLSAIVQKLTGQRLVDYLRPRLFDLLGISGATWEQSPQGIDTGGWGLNIKTEDIARFGQLYLQKGMWQGKQLIPAEWVAEATRAQVDNSSSEASPDWQQGYGYQFWRCRHNAYRGDGAFGQFCVVLPDQDAVIAITSGVQNMQSVLDLIWTQLLPAMQPAALPADPVAQAALADRLAGLALAPLREDPRIQVTAKGLGQTYRFPANDLKVTEVRLNFRADGVLLEQCDDLGQHRVLCGHSWWIKGETTLGNPWRTPRKVAASGAWTGPQTYSLRLCFYETPFCPTITCRFHDGGLTYEFKPNVGFGPLENEPIEGKSS